MKSLLGIALLLFSPAALAASQMPALNVRALVWNVIVLLGVAMIFGLLAYAVKAAPFIAEPIKSFILWALIVIACLFLIYLILGFIGL